MTCRLCGSADLKLHYTQGNQGEFRFYSCLQCSLVNYDLSPGLSQEKYSGAPPDPFDNMLKTNRAQSQTYDFLARRIHGKGKLLDIGCGNGRLLHLAQQDGWAVKGLELSPALAETAAKRLNVEVIAGDFLEFDPPVKGSFEVVVMRHVLEHLPEPLKAMAKVNSLLKTGGFALLEFPNIEAWDLKFKRFLRRIGLRRKKYRPAYVPGHCCEYNRRSFTYLASRTGFKIIIWQTYSYHPITNFIMNRSRIGDKARTMVKKIEACP